MYKSLLSVVLLFVGMFALAQPVANKFFVARGGYFSISYPGTWELNSNLVPGIYFQVYSPMESANDKIRESMNVVIEDLTGKNITLARYAEITQKNLLFNVKEYRLLSSKAVTIGSHQAHEITYTGKLNIYTLKFRAVLIMFENRAFVITYSGDLIAFDKFYPEAEKMIRSMRFQHVPAPLKSDSVRSVKPTAPVKIKK